MTGFNSKRDAAAAKLQEDQAKYGTSWSKDGERIDPMSVYKEPAQEPAEWSWVCNECGAHEFLSSVSESDLKFLSCGGCGCDEFHKENTASPPRPWVGLTDEERDDLLDTYITAEGRARAIEAKLKEKNT